MQAVDEVIEVLDAYVVRPKYPRHCPGFIGDGQPELSDPIMPVDDVNTADSERWVRCGAALETCDSEVHRVDPDAAANHELVFRLRADFQYIRGASLRFFGPEQAEVVVLRYDSRLPVLRLFARLALRVYHPLSDTTSKVLAPLCPHITRTVISACFLTFILSKVYRRHSRVP
jgi:hypothetical protein